MISCRRSSPRPAAAEVCAQGPWAADHLAVGRDLCQVAERDLCELLRNSFAQGQVEPINVVRQRVRQPTDLVVVILRDGYLAASGFSVARLVADRLHILDSRCCISGSWSGSVPISLRMRLTTSGLTVTPNIAAGPTIAARFCSRVSQGVRPGHR